MQGSSLAGEEPHPIPPAELPSAGPPLTPRPAPVISESLCRYFTLPLPPPRPSSPPVSLGISFPPTISQSFVAQNLAVAATGAYWSTQTSLVRCPATGCAGSPTVIDPANGGGLVAVDASDVYWISTAYTGSSPATLYRCPLAGCGGSGTPVAAVVDATALTVAGGTLYWIEIAGSYMGAGGTLQSCPVSGCTQPKTLAAGIPAPVGLATDGVNVYVTSAPDIGSPSGIGSVLRCPVTGCPGGPTEIATGQDIPGAIAVDDTSVYWVNQGGDSIMKLTPK